MRRIWAVGLALNFAFGIGLHFTVESLWIDRLTFPGLSSEHYLTAYTETARIKWEAKELFGLMFLADTVPPSGCAVGLLAVGVATGRLCWRDGRTSDS